MEKFYQTHKYLVQHVNTLVERNLMNEIDWNDRLIGIKGSRGVGKTTFLLEYAKINFGTSRKCLYINLNQFYFSEYTLFDFAKEFLNDGGETLLIDQMFKYHNWSEELRKIYFELPGLHIVFTGSSVMRLKEENEYLQDIVKVYNLRGFSFREYVCYVTKKKLPSYSFEQILNNNEAIVEKLLQQFNPEDYLKDYLHHGYYPFFMEKTNYSENLLKTMNMMIEVDVLFIKQIDLKYLDKIRKLLYLIGLDSPCSLNVSKLSKEIHISRATVMNYIKYLKDARLLDMSYKKDESYPKKPAALFLNNTNLMYVLQNDVKQRGLYETFFYNSVHKDNKINYVGKGADFVVNNKYEFKILTDDYKGKISKNIYYIDRKRMMGKKNIIPLWLLGFLY